MLQGELFPHEYVAAAKIFVSSYILIKVWAYAQFFYL